LTQLCRTPFVEVMTWSYNSQL